MVAEAQEACDEEGDAGDGDGLEDEEKRAIEAAVDDVDDDAGGDGCDDGCDDGYDGCDNHACHASPTTDDDRHQNELDLELASLNATMKTRLASLEARTLRIDQTQDRIDKILDDARYAGARRRLIL